MKLKSVRIQNLLSLEDETIQLDDYNVFVGPNAAGKTNFIRLLKLISSSIADSYSENRFLDLLLVRNLRRKPDRSSSIILEILFSDTELRMLLTFLLKENVSTFNGDSLRKIKLVIQWLPGPDVQQPPDIILLNFTNGFNLLCLHGTEFVMFGDKLDTKFLDSNIHSDQDLNNLLSQFESLSDEVFSEHHSSIPTKSRSINNLFFFDIFRKPFLTGQKFSGFEYMFDKYYARLETRAQYSHDWRASIFDYCGIINNRKDRIINCWTVIHSIMSKNVLFLSELRPAPSQLAKELFNIEKTRESTNQFQLIKNNFDKIFPDVKFEILKDHERGEGEFFIQIKDDPSHEDKDFNLESSASGYYEALCIFKIISISKDAVLLMDEPALHLHPTKIKFLARLLQTETQQVIVLTHSPFFLERGTFDKGRNLVYVQKQGDKSLYSSKSPDFQFQIISSLFRPEIFFSRYVILVEGASDAAVFSAISDRFENLFDKQDIFVLPAGGNGTVNSYHSLLNTYNIPHTAMVDSPYDFVTDDNFNILEGKLEDELVKVGWDGSPKKSMDSNEAYDFTFKLVQTTDGLNMIEKSPFGKIIIDSIAKTRGNNPFLSDAHEYKQGKVVTAGDTRNE